MVGEGGKAERGGFKSCTSDECKLPPRPHPLTQVHAFLLGKGTNVPAPPYRCIMNSFGTSAQWRGLRVKNRIKLLASCYSLFAIWEYIPALQVCCNAAESKLFRPGLTF